VKTRSHTWDLSEHDHLQNPESNPFGEHESSGDIQPHPIIHGLAEFLLAAQVPLRCLNGNVTQEKLNLLELPAGQVAQSRACASQIVWRPFGDSGSLGTCLDDVPNRFRSD
jgi:hypothetical protein